MALGSELGGESATSQDVGVRERRLALGAYEGWVVFPFASVNVQMAYNMYNPGHLQRVTLRPEGRHGVCLYCVVGAIRPRVL